MKPQNPGLASAPLVSDWITPEGEVMHVRTGRAELGQGAQTALLQLAAWEMGMPAEHLRITGPDTGDSPDEGFTAGSLSITQGGAALRAAASALRVLVLAEAARLLNADAGSLAVEDGRILQDGAETGLSLPAIAARVDRDVPVADHAAPRGGHGPQTARIDLRARMVGAPFVHDMAPEGCLAARMLHPPTLTARPSGLDGLADRPGVVEVVADGGFLGLIAEDEAAAAKALAWAEARVAWQDSAEAPSDPFALIDATEAEAEVIQSGDLPDTPPAADLTVRRPFLSHAAMGPAAAVALWQDGALTVWTHSQGVYPLKNALAEVLGTDRLRVIHAAGAGCYGHNGADDAALEAAMLARAVPGRPVRLTWSRASEFRAAPLGTAMTTRVRAWAGEGRLKALRVEVTSPPHATRPSTNGAPFLRSAAVLTRPHPYPAAPADLPMARGGGAARNAVPLYDAPAHVTRRLVTGLPWRTSSLRALGAHLNTYGIETAVEAAFVAEGIDPFEGRRASLTDPRAVAVLDRLEEMSRGLRAEATDTRGWGIALARYKNTAAWAAVLAEVDLGDEIRVPRVQVAVDAGEVVSEDGTRNQVEGGIVQALSWTLKEAVTLDGPRIATAGWEDYPILRFSEVPVIETVLIPRPDDPPLGVAEVVAGPTAAAMGNALQRLIGMPLMRLPLTREAVIAAVSDA